jgi:DNA (cytosine-5)-methyltransferase 1
MVNTIQILELFSGYGTATFALKQLGIKHKLIGYSDIDKYANQCFQQNHGGKELGDCTKINPYNLPNFNLLTGGFPCQSFSVAGKGLGELDTRGTLFHEIIRIAEVKKPRYMLLENVKGLTFKSHKKTFEKILSELKRIGYFVDWKILNTKDYGIPQNRERVFFACFREEKDFRHFSFPQKEELKIFLKDVLEDDVEEKYYLSDKQVTKLKSYLGKKNKINEEVMNCIGTCFGRSGSSSEECESFASTNKALMIGNLSRYKMKSERSMPFKEDGISWGLTSSNDIGIIQPIYISSTQSHNTIRNDGISNALPEAMGKGGGHTPMIIDIYNNKLKKEIVPTLTEPHHNNLRLIKEYRLRKLTPKECFRLQGFLNDEVNLDGLSNTQKYKLAGNGQTLTIVRKIFEKMFEVKYNG